MNCPHVAREGDLGRAILQWPGVRGEKRNVYKSQTSGRVSFIVPKSPNENDGEGSMRERPGGGDGHVDAWICQRSRKHGRLDKGSLKRCEDKVARPLILDYSILMPRVRQAEIVRGHRHNPA